MDEFDYLVLLTRANLIIKGWHDKRFMEFSDDEKLMEESWDEYKYSNDMKPITDKLNEIPTHEL